jgi:deoxyribodipyrimidine photolyase
VNFSADLDQRLRVTQTPTMRSRSFHSHRRGFYSTWPTYQQTEIRQYTKGTLGIDIVDAARRQLVWEGFALGRVTQRTTDNLGPVLDAAVVDIFREFPLPPK